MSTRDNYYNGVYNSKLDYNNADKPGRDLYYADVGRLTQLFKKDLFEEAGVTENPKAGLLFSKAWDLGHSAGLGEVALYFLDLVELIK